MKICVVFLTIVGLVACNGTDDSPIFSCGEEVSLEAQIMPIIQTECAVSLCHFDGTNPILDSKASIISNALNIRTQVESFQMPPGGQEPLTSEQIEWIGCWVEDGAEDN